MNTSLAKTLVTLSVLALGCGSAAAPRGAEAPEAAARTALGAEAKAATAALEDPGFEAAAEEAAPALARAAGDFIVHRFSGTFRKAPLTLTQKVVARDGMFIVVDVTLESGGQKTELRVRMNDAPAARGEVVSVARLEGGAERESTIAAYEALMAKVALAADQNEELLGSEDATIDVGGAAVACKRTSYRVKVGKQTATMRTLEKDGFAWGDLGGDITSKDGKVLYKAEVVEMGNTAVKDAAALAQTYTDD